MTQILRVFSVKDSSPDGVEWTPRFERSVGFVSSIAWAGGVFIALGAYGYIATSPDGVTWTEHPVGSASGNATLVDDVVWNGSEFLALGSGGGVLHLSKDFTWDGSADPEHGGTRIAYNGSMYVIVGSRAQPGWHREESLIWASQDGRHWTNRSLEVEGGLFDVAWDGKRFIAVGSSGITAQSNDGISWSRIGSGSTTGFNSIASHGSQFVAVGQYGTILTSANGRIWSESKAIEMSGINKVIWGDNEFVAVGLGQWPSTSGGVSPNPSAGVILRSSGEPGFSWTRLEFGGQDFYDVAWSGKVYVVVGYKGLVMTSSDGLRWVDHSLAEVNIDFSRVIWGQDRFVALSGPNIYTSTDGTQWSRILEEPNVQFNDLVWTGTEYFVVGELRNRQRGGSFSFRSSDGVNWVKEDSAPYGRRITWSGAEFVVAYGSDLWFSPNGSGWKIVGSSFPSLDGNAIHWDGSNYYIGGGGGKILRSEGLSAAIISTQPHGQAVAKGSSVTLTVEASGSAPVTYQWQLNGLNIQGATGSTLTLNGFTAAIAGTYTVQVSNRVGTVTSLPAMLTVGTPPVIKTQPQSQTATFGASVTFTTAISGGDPIRYQWKKDGTDIPGATNASLTLTGVRVMDAGKYSVFVSNPAGAEESVEATLTVASPSLAPVISSIPDVTTRVNMDTDVISFSVSDTATAAAELKISVSSDNPTLIPITNVQFAPIDSNVATQRAMIIRPAKDQAGTARITVVVSNANNQTASTTFKLTVLGQPPTISPIADQTIQIDGSLGPISFVVGDKETFPGFLVVTSTSSDPSFLANSRIVVEGGGANRTVTIGPVANAAGRSTVTLLVRDAEGQTTSVSFAVGTPKAENEVPAISSIANQATSVNKPTATSSFSVGDKETAPDALIVTASSSNKTLVPDGNIILGGTGASRTVFVQPATDQHGAATITITVTDPGNKSATTSFVLAVAAPAGVRGDFNGDGKPDLLFEDGDGFLAAWLMNGAALNSAEFLTPSNVGDADYRIVGSGDLDADGNEDLLFQHTDGTLAVWYMNGTTQIGADLINPSNPGDRNWRVIGVADLQKDGRMDLVFQHTDGTLAAWFMKGIKLSSAALLSPSDPGNGWKAVGLGDFDSDGMADLLFQHTDGTLAVWYLNGTELTRAELLAPANPGDPKWRVVSVANRNQDSKPDLIFQHSDGSLAVWFMDGTRLMSAALLNPSNSGATWRVVGPK